MGSWRAEVRKSLAENNSSLNALYKRLKTQLPCLKSFRGLGEVLSCSFIKWCSSRKSSLSSSAKRQEPYSPLNSVDMIALIFSWPLRSANTRHEANSLGLLRRLSKNSAYKISWWHKCLYASWNDVWSKRLARRQTMVGRHSLAVPLGANMRLSSISRWRWANQAVWLSNSAVLLTRSFRSWSYKK